VEEGVPHPGRVLRVPFETAEIFRREYAANLANGGVFVATQEELDLREPVRVELDLLFCKRKLVLAGEVVHRVTAEMASMGAPAGVAVQFDGSPHEVRAQLEPLRTLSGAPEYRPPDPGRRRSPRSAARVAARIASTAGVVSGITRNVSQTGVLISVPGSSPPVGERVRVSLEHPTRGHFLEVDGVVVRAVQTGASVSAVAVEFMPEPAEREAVQQFVEALQTSEHTRRLGGISGDLAELGIMHLVQMLSTSAPAGTLTVRRGLEEGVVGFEGGNLRYARLGPASGVKALVRLFGWNEGSFEFHARLDALGAAEPPIALEAALFDAVRLLDEMGRVDAARFPLDAKPQLAKSAAAAADDMSKVEAAVLDLARAGFSVGRMLDVIPEPDPEIYRALGNLSDSGAIRF
jgi:Tfp pilus assembly protein PilZ